MESLFENIKHISNQKLRQKLPVYKRFLFEKIKIGTDKIIGIYGSRGVGKTTLMLQVLQELNYASDEIVYISCDHPLFSGISLFEFAEYFYKYGGKYIVIDEIHEAKNFEQELKSIYDFMDIKIIFSGSSAVKITNASFARRYAMHKLPILSFREFCEIKLDVAFSSFTFENLLNSHENIAQDILNSIKDEKILKLYNEYLEFGAYPYYFAAKDSFMQKVSDTINTVLFTDVALLYKVSASNIEMLKKLLHTISLCKPLELSIESLSKTVGVSKATLYNYIEYLHRAELLRHIVYEGKRFKSMQMPDKLYLSNTSLLKSLTNSSDIGTMRETYFASQVSYTCSLYYVKKGDFLVDEKYTVEIGGKNKSFEQLKDVPNSYVIADDIEIGFKNRLPLWLMGFLY
ncbi:AAA family ATPase [Sulfurimonas sp. RIFOXYD2_FULL_34_21]|uniref:ATP-binding protein n=1 Tax=Sulfurimonas sp. RIFOXYD2_FULL_34_21 TaxID=1802261 RepID=UPI0008D01C76|nr:AAA family ATPase [Sulfurimonas sp. RIFOXYD2_FULL_34_21]OHE13950.1 MAG: AAA family ATPase [Sulfurimonas sp. RIFOXYD2_FULL_34_21]